MPYVLRKAPKRELYWVVNKDTGKKYSKDPLPKERAEAQMRALYAVESGYQLKGGAEMEGGAIHKSILQQMAQSAYAGKTKPVIGSFKLVFATPTLKFYRDAEKKLIVVSIRGTKDQEDLTADFMGLTGNLRNSQRYKKDVETMKKVQEVYPRSENRYIAVGHSLGGAILDLFLRDRYIQNGLSYNPFVEPQEMGGNPLHTRIYHKDDPLYKWFGHKIPNVEVRTTAEPIWKYYLKSYLPAPLGHLFQFYDRHKIRTFEGGALVGGKGFEKKLKTMMAEERARNNIDPAVLDQLEQTALDGIKLIRGKKWWKVLRETTRGVVGVGASAGIFTTLLMASALNPLAIAVGVPSYALYLVGQEMKEYDERKDYLKQKILDVLQSRIRQISEVPRANQQRAYNEMIDEVRDARPERTTMGAMTWNMGVQGLPSAPAPSTTTTTTIRNPTHSAVRNILPTATGTALVLDRNQDGVADDFAYVELPDEDDSVETATARSFVVPPRERRISFAPMQSRPPIETGVSVRAIANAVSQGATIGEALRERGAVVDQTGLSGKGIQTAFRRQLMELGIDPAKYLAQARKVAKAKGYDPKKLDFSDNKTHKLRMERPDGKIVRFGRVSYNDFLIWSHLEKNNQVSSGTAKEKQNRFLKSHSKIKGDWKNDKYSPNWLSMNVLW